MTKRWACNDDREQSVSGRRSAVSMTCYKTDIGMRVAHRSDTARGCTCWNGRGFLAILFFITVGVPLVIAAFKTEIDFRTLEVGRRIRPLPQLTLADGFPGTQTLELVARGRTTRRPRFFH